MSEQFFGTAGHPDTAGLPGGIRSAVEAVLMVVDQPVSAADLATALRFRRRTSPRHWRNCAVSMTVILGKDPRAHHADLNSATWQADGGFFPAQSLRPLCRSLSSKARRPA